MREFTDAGGVTWRVWSTVPLMGGVSVTFKSGWLTFESNGARRRLAPIPRDWEDASLVDLRQMLARAEFVGRTPISGGKRVDSRD